MEEGTRLHVRVELKAADLWKFSMYHANHGYMGVFNLLFTLAALYLLVTRWESETMTTLYRLLLIVCVLMFTVWQPGLLYLKAAKQAKTTAVKEPTELTFSDEGLDVEQAGQQVGFSWEQIARVVRTPFLYVVYMDRVHAYLLPMGQLDGKDGELRQLVKEKLPAARRRGI